MKTFAFIFSLVICGEVIFMTELSRNEMKYDCRLLIGGWHPDIPKQAVKQCKRLI